MTLGSVVEFSATLMSLQDPGKTRVIEGPYKIVRIVLKYDTKRPGFMGLTQYIEWQPCT
jgi:hypothetical protein